MSKIEIKNISHSFGEKTILNNTSFHLYEKEKVGLVGVNGAGKSTFLKAIANKITLDSFDIFIHPKISIGYLDQHASLGNGLTVYEYLEHAFDKYKKLEDEMNNIYMELGENPNMDEKKLEKAGEIQNTLMYSGYYEKEQQIKYVTSGLNINESWLTKNVEEMSGGQRTKILLCKLLIEKPDVLLLDEPTNFLDVEHINWLEKYLIDYESEIIMISHDINFMNNVCNTIWHFEDFKLKKYKGNYKQFEKAYELERGKTLQAYENQQKLIEKTKTFIAKNIARASTSGMAKSRQKMLDKIKVIEIAPENKKTNFTFKDSSSTPRNVLTADQLVIGYNFPLSNKINLSLVKGQKILVYGTNGIGKTTLIKTLIKQIEPLSGTVELGDNLQIGYFQQEVNFDNNITCFQYAWDHFPVELRTHQKIRSELAKVGLQKNHIDSSIKKLSGGEQMKVRFCVLMNNPYNILILDEPTNHLDKDSKENLKKALKAYQGTLILVTHEPEFGQEVCDLQINASQWKI